MPAKFQLRKGPTGKYRFVVLSSNGQVVATSEAYERKASALAGIRSIQKIVTTAQIEDTTTKEFAEAEAAKKAKKNGVKKAAKKTVKKVVSKASGSKSGGTKRAAGTKTAGTKSAGKKTAGQRAAGQRAPIRKAPPSPTVAPENLTPKI